MFPNPASEQVEVVYQIPKSGILKVYDYQGKLMYNKILDIGANKMQLKVEDWASGIYLYQLEVEA